MKKQYLFSYGHWTSNRFSLKLAAAQVCYLAEPDAVQSNPFITSAKGPRCLLVITEFS